MKVFKTMACTAVLLFILFRQSVTIKYLFVFDALTSLKIRFTNCPFRNFRIDLTLPKVETRYLGPASKDS